MQWIRVDPDPDPKRWLGYRLTWEVYRLTWEVYKITIRMTIILNKPFLFGTNGFKILFRSH